MVRNIVAFYNVTHIRYRQGGLHDFTKKKTLAVSVTFLTLFIVLGMIVGYIKMS